MPDRLQQALTVLETRFGSAAPRPAEPRHAVRSSGIPELDALTGIGGWPVGRLSLLAGENGSGKRTIAQRHVALASQEGATVYVDFRARLDPEFMHRLGACFERLLIVRPKTIKEGMEAARVLARAGAGSVCLDVPRDAKGLDAELPHLLHRAQDAECSLLLVHDAEVEDVIRYYASVIVRVERRRWAFHADGDLAGIEVEAAVLKNRMATPGRRARWLLEYPRPR
ncbi:MAG TPA: ATPase domain-containing protein [Candidatus Limnocylindrales bacterium]|nr:ATPase domain-containing protein [Candidatus Limnocylindrales bacterium]